MFKVKILSAIGGAVVAIFFLFHPVSYLQIYKDGRLCVSWYVSGGTVIHFQTVNSVEGSKWDEYWQLSEDGGLYVVSTVYRDVGAGFPIAPSGREAFRQLRSGFCIYNMHRRVTLPVYIRFDGKRDVVVGVGERRFVFSQFGEGLYTLRLLRVPWVKALFVEEVKM